MSGRYDIDDLLARVDLAALADELLGARRGHGAGARWPSPTPGHPQTGRTPPTSIRLDPDGRERFHCWATGARGTAIDLVALIRGSDVSAAIEWLAQRANASPQAPIVRRPPLRPAPASGVLDPAIEQYVAMGERWLWTPSGRGPLRYLTEQRGLDVEVLRLNCVGFDPGPRLERRPDGLPHSPGIILPTFNESGDLAYVQTRNINPATTRKYINPSSELAANPRLSWPRSATRTNSDALVVCEGLIDALTLIGIGRQAVALLGATNVDERIVKILASRPERLVLALDNDPAGQHAHASLKRLLEVVGHRRVEALAVPVGHDVNTWLQYERLGASVTERAHQRCPPVQAL